MDFLAFLLGALTGVGIVIIVAALLYFAPLIGDMINDL